MDRLSADAVPEVVVFEGWLNVWEVGKEMMKNLLSDGKGLKPIWEPHLCVLNLNSRKLSHFRTEKAARDARQNMAVTVEHIGSTKEEFDRRYGYKQVDKHDLLINSPLDFKTLVDPKVVKLIGAEKAGLDAAIEKSRTLDSRNSHIGVSGGGTMPSSFEKSSSPPDGCRGSTSSLNSQEVVKPVSSSQSKLANFFSKKLKRTKSATKLDRKKIGNGANGDAENDNKLPSPFVRSLSLGRISRRWLARPQIGRKGSEPKLRDDYTSSEKIRNQKMGKSYSHESLLTSESSLHCINLSNEGVEVRPLHCSILGLDNCFVVIAGGSGGCKYYGCASVEERNAWIRHLRHVIQPSLNHSYRKENSLEITIAEAKNLPVKRKYFCEICIDRTVYARTTSKPMQDMLFWGEHFEFLNLPLVEKVTLNLYRETEKKKKKDKHMLLAYVNILMSEINNRQMCERWFSASSAVVGKLGKENRSECASIRLKARYQSISILPISLYQPLINYLRSEYRMVVDTLEPVVSVKAKEEIAASMVTSSHCLNCVTTFICDIVMTEFNRSDNITLALRGNSIATKAVEAYMRLVGSKYLTSTLSEMVKMLLDPSLDCEVDPARVSSAAALKANQEALIKHCETFWYKIYNSFPSFPIELRRVFSAIRLQSSRGSYSGDICDQLISSCVFLRFFCPAILNPSLFNITQEYPDERGARNLTLVAKTMQGLANLTRFGGKEEFMTFMNNFVSRELSQMRKFLNYISELESDHGLEMQFDGEVDLGKELAVLHRLLVESLKDTNEVAKEKLGELPSILQDITVAQNHPMMQPLNKKSHLSVNLDSSSPSASEGAASLITPLTIKKVYPPCTPTTVVSPTTPETITPSTHFASAEIKSPSALSFISTTSVSISASPQSRRTPVFNVSNLPCSPSVRRIGAGQRGSSHHQSTDDLLFTHKLDCVLPLHDESLSPPISSLSSKRPDERQLSKDWEKLKDAADKFSTSRHLKLIAFNDGTTAAAAAGEGSLDRKLGFPDRYYHRKGSDVLPLSRPFFTSDVQDFQRGLPVLKPLAFSNPVYHGSDLNMRSNISAWEGVITSPHMGSTASLGNDDCKSKRPRRATPPRLKDGLTPLKATTDVCRASDCSKSSDSLTGRLGIEPCPEHKGKCIQMTIPVAGSSNEKRNSFCTTINVPMSKSLDFPPSSDSPLLSVRRVATDGGIVAASSFENSRLSPGPSYLYTPMTLPPPASRLRQTMMQSSGNKNEQTLSDMDCNDAYRRSIEMLEFSVDSVPLNSYTLPQVTSRARSMPPRRQRQNCDSAEFSRQMDIVYQTVAETQAMVSDAELQLLGEHGGTFPSSTSGLPVVPSLAPGTDQPCHNNSLREESLENSTQGNSSVQMETGSSPAAAVESHDVGTDNVAPGDQVSLHGEIMPGYVDMHNETVYTLTLNDHNQPFKTTYC